MLLGPLPRQRRAGSPTDRAEAPGFGLVLLVDPVEGPPDGVEPLVAVHAHALQTTSRPYVGDLYGIAVGGAETWSTDGHEWTVKLSDAAARLWGVYLMRRGAWWRVGKVRLRNRWGFGLKLRMHQEAAEEGWILSVHDTRESAEVAEQIVSVSHGIPTTFWQERGASRRTPALIARIYDALDLRVLQNSAERALTDDGRRIEFPFARRGEMIAKVGGRVASRVRSCNLLPGATVVPVPERSPQQRLGRPQPVAGRSHRFTWEPIRNVDIQPYEGRVYSMDVERFLHYIADGIVTHSCFYGWREGAAHRLFGPPNVPDVWPVKKVSPNKMVHLTEKPVELARRAIEYSWLGGEAGTLSACPRASPSGATLPSVCEHRPQEATMSTLIDRHLPQIEALCRTYRVRQLDVFGSAIREDFDPVRSDVDFLVEFEPDPDLNTFHAYMGLRDELSRLLERPVDLVMPSAVRNRYFAQEIAATREPLYGA